MLTFLRSRWNTTLIVAFSLKVCVIGPGTAVMGSTLLAVVMSVISAAADGSIAFPEGVCEAASFGMMIRAIASSTTSKIPTNMPASKPSFSFLRGFNGGTDDDPGTLSCLSNRV